MPARRFAGLALLCAALFLPGSGEQDAREHTFPAGIDALSARLPAKDAHIEISALSSGTWTDWTTLVVEDEQDPATLESQLLMLPRGVTRVRVRGEGYALHPIRVATGGIRYAVAATTDVRNPSVYLRSQWGADETLRYASDDATSSNPEGDPPPADPSTLSGRERACAEAQRDHPEEFSIARTVTEENGSRLRWPLQYSPSVKLLVVHHTAQNLTGDTRTGAERVRAVYQYHATNRGWGDIGYHFLIDTDGRIYEGKAGGNFVVGGHAYCNNIGTIGVALMGNFEAGAPPQVQVQSMQWLLGRLATTYEVELSTSVTYHGKSRAAVVAHRDLLSTDCPGYYLYGAMSQIRANVRTANWVAPVRFPAPPRTSSSSRSRSSWSSTPSSRSVSPPVFSRPSGGDTDTVIPIGATSLTLRPGQMLNFSVEFTAGKSYRSGTRIAEVEISDYTLRVWQEKAGRLIRIHSAMTLPLSLRTGETARLQMRMQAPLERGTYVFSLGDARYDIRVEGRSLPSYGTYGSSSASRSSVPSSEVRPPLPPRYPPLSSSSRSSVVWRPSSSLSSTYSRPSGVQAPTLAKRDIRIRLSFFGPSVTLMLPKGASIGTGVSDGTAITLTKAGDHCSADQSGRNVAFGTLRFNPGDAIVTVQNDTLARRYRGIIECRVWNDALVIINELPLEQYMAGIAEEPDTEPYEKQRAFAIAARGYAAYYMDPAHRKFPDAPFDGSDSPAEFQFYTGVDLEEKNPRWVQAVRDTELKVIVKNGDILKLPYFSTDDGRTRSPEEAGWKNFPYAEVFASKPDPWCKGMENRGHGVGMSGCGAGAQAREGKTAEEILSYYYPTTAIVTAKEP